MSKNDNEDVTECEKILGKPLPPPDEGNSIAISQNIAERLETGIIKDDRLENYEKYWMDKIDCIDESHSVRNNLDLEEAEQTLKRLIKYTESVKPKVISEEQSNLQQCFSMSRGKTLQCSKNVEEFIQHVDQSLYDAVRKDGQDFRSNKKMSFAEKFKRGYTS